MGNRIFGASVAADILKWSVWERQDMGMRVPSKNSLPGTQVVVNALIVLIDVAAGAEALSKVAVGVVRLVGHWPIGQKRNGSGIEARWIDHVQLPIEGELRPAGCVGRIARCACVCTHTASSWVVDGKHRGRVA